MIRLLPKRKVIAKLSSIFGSTFPKPRQTSSFSKMLFSSYSICINLALRQAFRRKLFAKYCCCLFATNLGPAVEETCELVDGGEHLQQVAQPRAERVKAPKDVFLAETEHLRLLHNLERYVKNSNAYEGTHVFVLNLLVRLPVVRVQLDALRQLALDDLPLLSFLVAC